MKKTQLSDKSWREQVTIHALTEDEIAALNLPRKRFRWGKIYSFTGYEPRYPKDTIIVYGGRKRSYLRFHQIGDPVMPPDNVID